MAARRRASRSAQSADGAWHTRSLKKAEGGGGVRCGRGLKRRHAYRALSRYIAPKPKAESSSCDSGNWKRVEIRGVQGVGGGGAGHSKKHGSLDGVSRMTPGL